MSGLQAQESEKYLKLKTKLSYHEATVLMLDSTVLEGIIDERLTDGTLKPALTFISKSGVRKTYYPNQVREFHFLHGKYFSDGKAFYRINLTGSRINLYTKTEYKNWGSGTGSSAIPFEQDKTYVKKVDDDTFIQVRKKGFVKVFTKYFSDCESLQKRIMSKELTHNDFKEIAKLYNRCD